MAKSNSKERDGRISNKGKGNGYNKKINKDRSTNNGARDDSQRPFKGKKRSPILDEDMTCGRSDLGQNHYEWILDPHGVVEDALRLPTNMVKGRAYWPNNSQELREEGLPTVCICDFMPLPVAESLDSTSPASIVAQMLYQTVRQHLNKPITGYQAADPLIAYIAFTSIALMANEIRRDYGIMNVYSTENVAYPKQILKALGYNEAAIKDLSQNMANYRQRYNLMLYQASTIFTPVYTHLTDKYDWYTQGLWYDNTTDGNQVYGFNPEGYYALDETGEQGTSAVWMPVTYEDRITDDKLFKTKLDGLESMLSRLRDSESYNAMMSDLRNAFPTSGNYNFILLSDDYMVKPVVNEDMLKQFQNLTTLPQYVSLEAHESLNITQDVMENAIICSPKFSLTEDCPEGWADILNKFYSDVISNGLWVNWSQSSPDSAEIANSIIAKSYFTYRQGFVMPVNQPMYAIYTKFRVFTPQAGEVIMDTWYTYQIADGEFRERLRRLAYFDFHPMVFVSSDPVAGPTATVYYWPHTEANNLMRISSASVDRLSEAAQYGIWQVPEEVKSNMTKI